MCDEILANKICSCDAERTSSDDDGRTFSTAHEEEDDTLPSCFDFRLRTRSFDLTSSTFGRRAPLSRLARLLRSGSDSSVRCSSTTNRSIYGPSSTPSSSCRFGTGTSTSPSPLILPSPDLRRRRLAGVVTGSVDSPSYDYSQVLAAESSSPDSDVADDATERDRGLALSSRFGGGLTRLKQRSQHGRQQTTTLTGWRSYYMQPSSSSSSSSSLPGFHHKRTSFHHEVQVIEIDQTQRVRRVGTAPSRHTERLRESEAI